MPVLKFETKLVNGRPNIIFETEYQKNMSKKRNYKTKVQKYPLRNVGGQNFEEISENNAESDLKREKIKGNVNKVRKNSNSPLESRSIDVDIYDISNKRTAVNHNNRRESKEKKESLFNFLKTEPNTYTNENNSAERKYKKTDKVKQKKLLTDEDIDDIMKEVVLKNKDILTDDQLVDLLAKIYIEAKKGYDTNNGIPQRETVKLNNKNQEVVKSQYDFVPSIDIENITVNAPENPPPKILHNYLPLTMAQKKQLQWDQERKDLEKITSYNPWGRPGCGAPPKEPYEIPTNDNYQSNHNNVKINMDINRRIPSTRSPEISGLSQAKKQLQWEQERKELEKITSYDPWGRPGCGAPPKDSYQTPANDNHQYNYNNVNYNTDNNKRIPSARSSELTGLSQAEIKRRQWLAELNEQVAEKERTKSKVNDQSVLMSDIHIPGNLSPGHGRGKGLANLNQVTSEELNLKRFKQIEQQEAIKRQIEEKELLKRLEREQNALLDQQEDLRINKEKQLLDSQYLNETSRVKQKEDESGRRFALLRSQVEEAERAALLEKRMKRLQHLELAGHDTRQLRAGLVADQMTGRLAASTEFVCEDNNNIYNNNIRPDHESLKETYNQPRKKGYPITEDQGIQTDGEDDYKRRNYNDYDTSRNQKEYRNRSVEVVTDDIRTPKLVRKFKNNEMNMKKTNEKQFRVPSATYTKQEEKVKSKRPESIGIRKPWGVKKVNKKYIPQSKRDPFYTVNKNEREYNKHERVNKILAQVRANLDRIPDTEVVDGHLSQRHKRCDDRKVNEQNKENIEINKGTYDLRDGNILHLEDDNDRVQASVRYKDSYRQPTQNVSQRITGNQSQRNAWSPNNQGDIWDDTDCEIVRTTDILDPTKADQKCLISRENTGRERARQSYFKSQNPGKYGDDNTFTQPRNYQEKHDPLSYPPSHPTNRQNTIMKQLSEIREDLRMRQKEIETSLSFNGDF